MKKFILIGLIFCVGCGAKIPPNLTPQAVTAYKNTGIQQALDQIRDRVDDGTKTTPPVFSKALDVKVATWHESISTIIHTGGTGWQAKVNTALDDLIQPNMGFSAAQIAVMTPYITLAKTLVKEF